MTVNQLKRAIVEAETGLRQKFVDVETLSIKVQSLQDNINEKEVVLPIAHEANDSLKSNSNKANHVEALQQKVLAQNQQVNKLASELQKSSSACASQAKELDEQKAEVKYLKSVISSTRSELPLFEETEVRTLGILNQQPSNEVLVKRQGVLQQQRQLSELDVSTASFAYPSPPMHSPLPHCKYICA